MDDNISKITSSEEIAMTKKGSLEAMNKLDNAITSSARSNRKKRKHYIYSRSRSRALKTVSMLPISKTEYVSYLDLGCADGSISGALAEELKVKELFLVDIDPKWRTVCEQKQQHENFTRTFMLIKDDIIDLPDNSLDLITCFMVLHHVFDQNKIFSEISRVLKPGGILFVREHDIGIEPKQVVPYLNLLHLVEDLKDGSTVEEAFIYINGIYYLNKNTVLHLCRKYGLFQKTEDYYQGVSNPQHIYHISFVKGEKIQTKSSSFKTGNAKINGIRSSGPARGYPAKNNKVNPALPNNHQDVTYFETNNSSENKTRKIDYRTSSLKYIRRRDDSYYRRWLNDGRNKLRRNNVINTIINDFNFNLEKIHLLDFFLKSFVVPRKNGNYNYKRGRPRSPSDPIKFKPLGVGTLGYSRNIDIKLLIKKLLEKTCNDVAFFKIILMICDKNDLFEHFDEHRKSLLSRNMQSCPKGLKIAIEAPIGAGKTKLCTLLKNSISTQAEVTYEDIPIDPLNKYIADMEGEALNFQTAVYKRRVKQLNDADKIVKEGKIAFLDRSIYGDYAFMDMHKKAKRLNDTQIKKIKSLSNNSVLPDLVVYLSINVTTSLKRIKKRGRPGEEGYTEEYLTEFIKSHEKVIKLLDPKKTIILDWNIDRNDKKILNDFIKAIKTKIQLSLTVE